MIFLMLLSFMIQASAPSPADSRPLPDLSAFLEDIRKNLHSDRIVQSRYTYTEQMILRQLDSKGRVKETDTRVYEVYPSLNERLTYRRLISKNGEPLSPGDIKKQDNAYDKKRRDWEQKLARENADRKQRREAEESEAGRREDEALEEALRFYDIKMIGREPWEGIPVIALTFDPRPGSKPKTEYGKILAKVKGKAWFGEEDHELVRIDAELVDTLSFGLGVVARLNKGTRLYFERRRVNREVWLPAVAQFQGTGRILLLKGFRVDMETIYSDYRKFSVETDFSIQQRKSEF